MRKCPVPGVICPIRITGTRTIRIGIGDLSDGGSPVTVNCTGSVECG
jgi:hypothetical protein